jgi:hypothetical protein
MTRQGAAHDILSRVDTLADGALAVPAQRQRAPGRGGFERLDGRAWPLKLQSQLLVQADIDEPTAHWAAASCPFADRFAAC